VEGENRRDRGTERQLKASERRHEIKGDTSGYWQRRVCDSSCRARAWADFVESIAASGSESHADFHIFYQIKRGSGAAIGQCMG